MATYKRSSYDLFIHKVLLPNIRTILLVVAAVALGCGSWLETHPTTDCAFQTAMSVFEVSIYQNISDRYALTPSSVTFGLWKHCFYYTQNCTCTPISLGYEIDAEQSIFAATNNMTMPSVDTSQPSSYLRLIPLILALVLSVMAFGYSFWATRSRPLVLFWINGGMAFVGAVLVAIAFGGTYHSYRSSILKACQAANMQSVRCASMAPKLEVTLLAVALGLLLLASALFGCVRTSETNIYKMDEKKQIAVARKPSQMMKSNSHLSDTSTSSKEFTDATWEGRHHHLQHQHQQHHQHLFQGTIPPARSNEYAFKNTVTGHSRRSSPPSTLLSSIPSTSPNNKANIDKRRQKPSSSPSNRYHHGSHDFTPPALPYGDHQQKRYSSDSANQPRAHEDPSSLEDRRQDPAPTPIFDPKRKSGLRHGHKSFKDEQRSALYRAS